VVFDIASVLAIYSMLIKHACYIGRTILPSGATISNAI